jgi:GNAT superfamily N-acetyltransferase
MMVRAQKRFERLAATKACPHEPHAFNRNSTVMTFCLPHARPELRIEKLADHPQHAGAVAELQHATFGHLNPTLSLTDRTHALVATLAGDGLPITFLAFMGNGTLAGAATLVSSTLIRPDLSPWMSMVVTHPSHRGRGVASALSLAVAAEAARRRFECVHLFTPRNESLYLRLGWRRIGQALIGGAPVAVMARPTEHDGQPTLEQP